LDVGAGSGIFSRQLLDAGICNRAICVDPAYAKESDEIHNGKEILFRRTIEGTRPNLILMMDVLEHVDDDLELLKQYTEKMPADGHVLITVPAFEFLWSEHDVFLEHRRRYTLKQLERVVSSAGLNIVRSRYFFGSLLPIVIVMRVFNRIQANLRNIEPRSDLKVYPSTINSLLISIHDLERFLLFPFNTVAGLTVFCLARRF
jgi:hypothetical protein